MKTSSQPTLADVARSAGVGVATASRVVNGGAKVSQAAIKRVEAAVQQLGYLPNHAARILRGGRTKTIGLLVPSIADSFFSTCAKAADEVARRHDCLLIVAVSGNNAVLEMNSLRVLMRHQPDGLLIVPAQGDSKSLAAFVRSSGVPTVAFDRPIPGCPTVLTDNQQAFAAATQHLVEHGRKRILCYGGEPDLFTIQARLRGYQEAMQQARLAPLVDTTFDGEVETTQRTLAAHLNSREPPDAIITLKNSVTTVTFQALQRLRISVPLKLALLGFDDFELASTLRPAISVVQQPIELVGRTAAKLLFSQLAREQTAQRKRFPRFDPTVLTSSLILRSSCGCRFRDHSAPTTR
jgi:LacI family transcriptional regulator